MHSWRSSEREQIKHLSEWRLRDGNKHREHDLKFSKRDFQGCNTAAGVKTFCF